MQVGSLLNFSLMYFLAPTAASGSTAAAGRLMSRIFSNSMLTAWGAPGGAAPSLPCKTETAALMALNCPSRWLVQAATCLKLDFLCARGY